MKTSSNQAITKVEKGAERRILTHRVVRSRKKTMKIVGFPSSSISWATVYAVAATYKNKFRGRED